VLVILIGLGWLTIHTLLYKIPVISPQSHIGGFDLDDVSWRQAIVWVLEDLDRTSVFIHVLMVVGAIGISTLLAKFIIQPLAVINRAQQRFIADAAHELRTPITVIRSTNELALMDGRKIKPRTSMATMRSTIEEVVRMGNIIRNLRNISQGDHQAEEMPFAKTDISTIVKSVVSELKRQAIRRCVSVEIDDIPGTALVWGNDTALRELIFNILRNAISYTPDGGQVKIDLKTKNKKFVYLGVKDTGIGISHKDLPHIFNPFFRGKNYRKKPSGTGLGLAIVKEIAKKHRGTVRVLSKPNRGTTVEVLLPTI